MTTSSRIVSEEEVHNALNLLETGAAEIGELTREARLAEAWVKVALAMTMKTVEGPVNAQEREARASHEYRDALEKDAKAAGDLAKAKALREAAAMRIEVWRTQQATWRAMKL